MSDLANPNCDIEADYHNFLLYNNMYIQPHSEKNVFHHLAIDYWIANSPLCIFNDSNEYIEFWIQLGFIKKVDHPELYLGPVYEFLK